MISDAVKASGVSFLGEDARAFDMTRIRGNPNWGKPVPIAHAAAPEFEIEMRRLGLTTQTCASSMELRRWCELNKNRCFIPEWLLKFWGIVVHSDLSGAA